MKPEEFQRMIQGRRIAYGDEEELQSIIGGILAAEGVNFRREVRLSASERVDFLIDDGLVVEVKLKGSHYNVLRQLQRYAKHAMVEAIVLLRPSPMNVPATIEGKPCLCVPIFSNLI